MQPTAPRSILAKPRLSFVLKLGELDGAFRELGGDFEFPAAQGFDEILERAHVHIRAALEFRCGDLVNGEDSLTHSRCSKGRRGPFDSAGTSLREVPAALWMTELEKRWSRRRRVALRG